MGGSERSEIRVDRRSRVIALDRAKRLSRAVWTVLPYGVIAMSSAGDATAQAALPRVDAVIFDVDGLLIDSESASHGCGRGAEVA